MKEKILFINGHLNTGGVEKSLIDILTHLDYKKYDVDLLLLEQLGDYVHQIPKEVNIIYRSIEKTYGPLFKVFKDCLKRKDWFSLKIRLIFLIMKIFGQKKAILAKKLLTDGKKYECAIGFRPGFCTQVAAYAVNSDKKITWWHHGEINIDHNSYLEVAAEFDCIVAVSDYCNRMISDEWPILTDKIITINNIVDEKAIKAKANEFDPGYKKDLINIVSVGRLAKEKHYDNAIYTASVLKESGIDFEWHLIGDGILRDELKLLAKEFDVEDCFTFEGNQINPYPYIKHADLFVHPSYVESFGLVVAEALCLGIPSVVTNSEGVLGFLKDKENTLLTERDRGSLSEKTLMLLNDKQLFEKIKYNSFCPTQVMPDKIIEEIDCLIEKAI